MSFKRFIKELNGNRVEGELVKTVVISLIVSLLTLGVLYFAYLKNNPNILPKYGFYLFFSALSVAFIMPTVRQVSRYKEFNCMSGMMIGMTSGMIAGFLPGYYIGATNGMFLGSVFGMFIGIVIGIWLGSSCGVMGAMEGLMAGFMGGLMGAMTSVMLINDHLRLATVIISIIGYVILFGLNYMIYKEMHENESQKKEDYFLISILTLIIIAITTLIMIFGPRGPVYV